MSSVSTAFKVQYKQKLGDPSGHLGGTHHGLWGIDAHGTSTFVATESRHLLTNLSAESWISATGCPRTDCSSTLIRQLKSQLRPCE